MDRGTQQNAAMVEESTAASHSLAKEAKALFALLAQFRTAAEAGHSERRAEPADRAAPAKGAPPAARHSAPARGFDGNAALAADPWDEF
jgi:methyl-accepting chemotaxis protein